MAGIAIRAYAPLATVAPAGVWFEAVDPQGFALETRARAGLTYDPAFHELHYTWQVTGPPKPYEAPVNMVRPWNNMRLAHGPKVALFFPDPGGYEVRLTARDARGTVAEAAYRIDIASPETSFPGVSTLCVAFDPGESWAEAPAGAVRLTSFAALEKALARAAGPTRLLFRRGETFELEQLRFDTAAAYHVDAWGQGAAPVLRTAFGQRSPILRLTKRAQARQFTVANLEFRGHWNPVTETGIASGSPLEWTPSRQTAHYTVWNSTFRNYGLIDFQVNKSVPATVLIGNSTITSWQNFGTLFRSDMARLGLAGMCMAQHPEALHGGIESRALSNRGGPVRITKCRDAYIGCSDFFSRSGWSGLAGELADQPCLRLNTSGEPGSSFTLDRVVCEGGYHVVNMAGSNPRVPEHPGNYVIDKALLVATAKTIGPFIANDFGGVTARNVLAIRPDVVKRHPNRWLGGMHADPDNPTAANLATPVALHSSTFLNLASGRREQKDRWTELFPGHEAFQDVTIENTLMADGIETAKGLFDLSESFSGIRLRYRGIRYGFRNPRGKLERAIGPGQSLLVPYDQITRDMAGAPETGPTNARYWRETEATDRQHVLTVAGVRRPLYAVLGAIAVRFEDRGVAIQNRGRDVWEPEAKWVLKLDRTSRLPEMDTRFASPERLPVPFPRADVPRATAGRIAFDDFLGRPRGPSGAQGALIAR